MPPMLSVMRSRRSHTSCRPAHTQMLVLDPSSRHTAAAVQEHTWVIDARAGRVGGDARRSTAAKRGFDAQRKLRTVVLGIIAKQRMERALRAFTSAAVTTSSLGAVDDQREPHEGKLSPRTAPVKIAGSSSVEEGSSFLARLQAAEARDDATLVAISGSGVVQKRKPRPRPLAGGRATAPLAVEPMAAAPTVSMAVE